MENYLSHVFLFLFPSLNKIQGINECCVQEGYTDPEREYRKKIALNHRELKEIETYGRESERETSS